MTFRNELEMINACPGSITKYGNMSLERAIQKVEEAHWLAWYLMMTGYDLTEVIPQYLHDLERMTTRQAATRVCNRISQLTDQVYVLNVLKMFWEETLINETTFCETKHDGS